MADYSTSTPLTTNTGLVYGVVGVSNTNTPILYDPSSIGDRTLTFTAPTGFSVVGSPLTGTGTISLGFSAGYSLPTTASQTNWDTAYSWGDHAAAGYLDEYEEGTWLATFVPSNNGFTPTSNISVGRYVKVGKLVTALGCAVMTVPASLGTYVNNSVGNSLSVTGLPFSIVGDSNLRSAPSLAISTGIATVAGTLVGEGAANTTIFSICESKDNGSLRTGPTLTVSTSVALRFQFTYITN